jgi:DNA-binding response OmpR family regulator
MAEISTISLDMTPQPLVLIIASKTQERRLDAARLRERWFDVLEADGVDAALTLADARQPHAILTECELRDGDCSNLLRAFATLLPVSVILRAPSAETRCWALELGADDVLDWPMDSRELSLRLNKSIGRWRGHEDRMLRAGDLRLDPLTRTAFNALMAGVRLTSAEFEALRLLMLNPGRHVPKGLIYEAAVGGRIADGSRAVDLLMSKARRKLRSLAPQNGGHRMPRIVAARGAGYCLQTTEGAGPRRANAKIGDSGAPAVSKGRRL